MVRLVRRRDGRGWLVAILPCMFLAGCGTGKDEGIKTYRVATPQEREKSSEQAEHRPPVPQGPPKVRLLGAIIPIAADTSYFLKFKGPIEQIDAHEKEFDEFLNSIRIPGEGGKPISWKAPASWKEGAPKTMRVVTFTVIPATPPAKEDVEAYISNPFQGSLLLNVNRWRTGDLGLPEVSEAELSGVTKEIMLGATKAYRVDFRGPGGKGMMGKIPLH